MKFYDDYEFDELYELAGAVRNRLRFHFVKFVKININAQPKFVKFVKFVVLKKQCAAKIRIIREIRSKKKIDFFSNCFLQKKINLFL